MNRQDDVGMETGRAESDPDEDAFHAAVSEAADFKAENRLAGTEPRRSPAQRFRALMPLALASTGVHLLILATVFLLSRTPAPAAAPQETAVEVVQEEPLDKKAEEAKPADQHAEEAKAEPPAQPEPKQEEAKREEAQKEPPPEQRAAEPAQPTPQQQAKLEPPTPPQPTAEDAAHLQALQDELANLKSQQAELQAQQADLEAQAQAQAKAAAAAAQAQGRLAENTKALGLLPESFAAATVPSLSPTGDEAVSYQQVVYSIVTKAKRKDLAYMRGVAHVVFEIDDRGGLKRVTVDQSSGNPAVDKEAVALIRRAAPFPPPPAGAPRSFPGYMSFVPDH